MPNPSEDKMGALSREAAGLAARAEAMGAALRAALSGLSGLEGVGEPRAQLERLARGFETQRMRARDIASGAHARRKQPLARALDAARESGGALWEPALALLAQAALDEERPAWYAGAMLAMLGVEVPELPRGALRALALPLDFERALRAEGYAWDWPAGLSEESRLAWSQAARGAGVAP